jgi:membrane-bound lytic murein transglycosylase D
MRRTVLKLGLAVGIVAGSCGPSFAELVTAPTAPPASSAVASDPLGNAASPTLVASVPFTSDNQSASSSETTAVVESAAEPSVSGPSSEPAAERDTTAAVEEPSPYNIPIVRDEKVETHLRFFHTSIRERFEQWLIRLGRYKPTVDRIFSEFNLPSDLVFLSLVESGFNPHAYSRARATGPWQFMKGTAKLYGLRVDDYVDERRDPIKSTVAAARYLRDLYDLFGAWPLAMAAYNAGEGKVLRALNKAQADSFSEIAGTKLLRRETREYVPRIMAATIIAKNPMAFGFSAAEPEPHEFEEVAVPGALHFRDIERVAGISMSELRHLNPELRKDVTPPGEAGYQLKVPVGTKASVEQVLDRIPLWKPPARAQWIKHFKHNTPVHQVGGESGWYRVKVGDSLSTIAKRFRLTVPELKTLNHLPGTRIKPGDLLDIHP